MKVVWKTSTPLAATLVFAAQAAWADEGGVGFWLPGNFGSFAAVPSEPGWALPMIYYHGKATEDASVTFPRGGRIAAGVDARSDFLFVVPTYTFTTPVAGGHASAGVAAAFGNVRVGIDATLTGPLGATLSGSESDSRTGLSDLYPTASLKWNSGVHNYMLYTMAGIPVGVYDKERLANLGTNHWAVDGGGGYTYFDKKYEFSAVVGFTYSFENPDTDYKNGVSAHLDWAASCLFSPTFHAGLVGYFYNQLTGDSGAGATLGDFKSRVSAIGPQAGWFLQDNWYLNVKGYQEFGARNRPEGWNVWLTLAIPIP